MRSELNGDPVDSLGSDERAEATASDGELIRRIAARDTAALDSVSPGLKLQPLAQDYDVAPPVGDGVTAASVALLTNAAPPSAASVIAAAQAGFYSCVWAGDQSQPIDAVALSVLPNAATAFATAKATGTTVSPESDVTLLPSIDVGDDEFAECADDEGLSGCQLNVLKGGTWLAIQLSHGAAAHPAPAEYTDALGTLARSALGRIFTSAMLPPQPAPTPASRWSPAGCDGIQRALKSQYPNASYSMHQPDDTDDRTPLFAGALTQSGAFMCLGSGGAPDVTVVPGAAS